MGLLQTHTGRPREVLAVRGEEQRAWPRFASSGLADEPTGRHEPQVLIERVLPADPYAVWLEQREAQGEREREARPQIRLVHRPRGGGGQGIVARRL